MSHTTIRFTVRKKGGPSAGKTLEQSVAEFNWEKFKNTPNAEAFVKKAYFAAAQKLTRELHESKSQTEEHHLQTMESLIARSLKFTKTEIQDWCESREWGRVTFKADAEKAIGILKENLPKPSSSEFCFPINLRERAAEIIAEVADAKLDPIADYLFVKLSQKSKDEIALDDL